MLADWFSMLSRSTSASQMYDEFSFLRNFELNKFALKILSITNQFNFKLEKSLTMGINAVGWWFNIATCKFCFFYEKKFNCYFICNHLIFKKCNLFPNLLFLCNIEITKRLMKNYLKTVLFKSGNVFSSFLCFFLEHLLNCTKVVSKL